MRKYMIYWSFTKMIDKKNNAMHQIQQNFQMPPTGGGVGIGVVEVDGVGVGVTVVVSSVVEIDDLVWLPVNYILKRIIYAQTVFNAIFFFSRAVYCDD